MFFSSIASAGKAKRVIHVWVFDVSCIADEAKTETNQNSTFSGPDSKLNARNIWCGDRSALWPNIVQGRVFSAERKTVFLSSANSHCPVHRKKNWNKKESFSEKCLTNIWICTEGTVPFGERVDSIFRFSELGLSWNSERRTHTLGWPFFRFNFGCAKGRVLRLDTQDFKSPREAKYTTNWNVYPRTDSIKKYRRDLHLNGLASSGIYKNRIGSKWTSL